jgi:hypothetical protein
MQNQRDAVKRPVRKKCRKMQKSYKRRELLDFPPLFRFASIAT